MFFCIWQTTAIYYCLVESMQQVYVTYLVCIDLNSFYLCVRDLDCHPFQQTISLLVLSAVNTNFCIEFWITFKSMSSKWHGQRKSIIMQLNQGRWREYNCVRNLALLEVVHFVDLCIQLTSLYVLQDINFNWNSTFETGKAEESWNTNL